MSELHVDLLRLPAHDAPCTLCRCPHSPHHTTPSACARAHSRILCEQRPRCCLHTSCGSMWRTWCCGVTAHVVLRRNRALPWPCCARRRCISRHTRHPPGTWHPAPFTDATTPYTMHPALVHDQRPRAGGTRPHTAHRRRFVHHTIPRHHTRMCWLAARAHVSSTDVCVHPILPTHSEPG